MSSRRQLLGLNKWHPQRWAKHGHGYFAYWFCHTWMRSPLSSPCSVCVCVCPLFVCVPIVCQPSQLESTTSCVVVRDNVEQKLGFHQTVLLPHPSLASPHATEWDTTQHKGVMISPWRIRRRQEDRKTHKEGGLSRTSVWKNAVSACYSN